MNRINPIRRPLTALLTVLAVGATVAVALPARADEMSWRQTSIAVGQDGMTVLRAGVAIVNNKEAATMSVRIRPKAPPQNGLMPVATEMQMRFEDGSTIVYAGEGQTRVDAQGIPIRGEGKSSGRVLSGTGRFQGITGTYEMRVRTDLDRMADGMLGDYFGVVQATVTMAK